VLKDFWTAVGHDVKQFPRHFHHFGLSNGTDGGTMLKRRRTKKKGKKEREEEKG